MKHKLTKRSLPNKHPQQRSFQIQTRRLSTPHEDHRTISSSKIGSGTETSVHLDSHATCLKPDVSLKSQKLLKRDLLRCSNQRPSFLGLQTLQPPRISHGSQPIHSTVPTALNHQNTKRHGSLLDDPHTLHATINRIGPWPDISINYLRSEGNDLLQPLKNFRSTKNPRLFSPKYYAALSDNNMKFQYHSSKRSYIEEYRQHKGYVISSQPTPQPTPISSLSSSLGRLLKSDDDQLSVYGAVSGGTGSCTSRDRTEFSTTNLSIPPRSITRSVEDLTIHNNRSLSNSHLTTQFNTLPTIPVRNNNQLRTTRPMQQQQQQTITLPTIPSSSFQYLNSINALETPYDDHNKKLSIRNQSKLYFIDGRQQKSDSEVTSRSQDYVELRTTGSSIVPETERSAAVVLYQLARRT